MPNFDRYYGENSEDVSRETLSSRTKSNLNYLEGLGYSFSNIARKALFGVGPSYLIYGEDPQGLEAIYERRETQGKAAGQTLIWIEGKKYRLPPRTESGTLGGSPWNEAAMKREVKQQQFGMLKEVDTLYTDIKEALTEPPYSPEEVGAILSIWGFGEVPRQEILDRLRKDGLIIE